MIKWCDKTTVYVISYDGEVVKTEICEVVDHKKRKPKKSKKVLTEKNVLTFSRFFSERMNDIYIGDYGKSSMMNELIDIFDNEIVDRYITEDNENDFFKTVSAFVTSVKVCLQNKFDNESDIVVYTYVDGIPDDVQTRVLKIFNDISLSYVSDNSLFKLLELLR